MKLVIGAGTRRVEGFKHHDIQDLEGIDYVCEFFDLPVAIDEKCQEIHITHVLEHFQMKDIDKVFKVIFDLLDEGGKLYIEVPNFYWHALRILENPRDRQIVEYAFGGQHNEWDFHYNGFTPEILFEDLVKAGFIIKELNPNSSIECWAVKGK